MILEPFLSFIIGFWVGCFGVLMLMMTFVNNFLISKWLISISSLRYTLCGLGGVLLFSGLIVLTCIDQDEARHSFGFSGGMLLQFTMLVLYMVIKRAFLRLMRWKIKNLIFWDFGAMLLLSSCSLRTFTCYFLSYCIWVGKYGWDTVAFEAPFEKFSSEFPRGWDFCHP